MKKSALKIICILIPIILILQAGSGIAKEVNQKSNSKNKLLETNIDDYLDQKNEGGDIKTKIYGDNWYAQGFIPNADWITGISIKISRHSKARSNNVKDDSLLDSVKNFINKNRSERPILSFIKNIISKKSSDSEAKTQIDIGDLTISLYSTRYYSTEPFRELRNKTYSKDEIDTNAEWIKFEFGEDPITDGPFLKDYCIVVHAEGGDQESYYEWYMNDENSYTEGFSYSSEDDGSSWDMVEDKDFCFRSYGWDYSEEPDGTEKRYAVFTYDPTETRFINDCNRYKSTFLSRPEWESDNIWIYEYNSERNKLENKLKELDEYENEDDIILFIYRGHQTTLTWANEYLDRFGSKSIAMIIDCCKSGYVANPFKINGREILASSSEDELSWGLSDGSGSVFPHYILKGLKNPSIDNNNDGWISTKEVFDYASPLTTSYMEKWNMPQHPQFYDYIDDRDILLISTSDI